MNAFAGFNTPGFMPSINNTVYLVGTAADQSRMGGVKNRVYITAQTAYDAAVALRAALGSGTVYISVQYTTAAQVGNITLAAAWNTNISIVGLSPFVSTIGNISGDSAAGAAFAIAPPFISNLSIGDITARSTVSGAGGAITLRMDNVNVVNVISTATNAASASGAVTITAVTSTILNRSNYINVITTSHASTGAPGAVTIAGGRCFKIGTLNIRTGSNAVTNTNITISECDNIGTFNSPITGQGTLTISNCICGAFASGNATNNITDCKFTSTCAVGTLVTIKRSSVIGAFTFAGANNIFDCVFDSTFSCTAVGANSYITRSYFVGNVLFGTQAAVSSVQCTSCVFGVKDTNCTVSNIGNNSNFDNCVFISDTLSNISGLGVNDFFRNCTFVNAGNAAHMTNGTTTVITRCQGTVFVNNNFNQYVCCISEREHVVAIATSNATPNTSAVSVSIPTGQKVRIVASVTASTANDTLFAIKANTFKNVAGTVTKIGATDQELITTIADAALDPLLTTVAIEFAVSGTTARLSITGVAATNIAWGISLKITSSF